MKEIDQYFHLQSEPAKNCLLALRHLILDYDENVSEAWRYKMPFYLFKGKRFCYLWVDKKSHFPYLGIVDGKKISHPDAIKGSRKRMKIILFDPKKDIPIKKIKTLLKQLL